MAPRESVFAPRREGDDDLVAVQEVRDLLKKLTTRRGCAKQNLANRDCDHARMRVCVDQPRDDEIAIELVLVRFRQIISNTGIVADVDNSLAANCDGRSPWCACICGIYPAANENSVGRLRRSIKGVKECQEQQQRNFVNSYFNSSQYRSLGNR